MISPFKSSVFSIWFLLQSSVPPTKDKSAYCFSSEFDASSGGGLFVFSDSLKFLQLLSLNMRYSIPYLKGF